MFPIGNSTSPPAQSAFLFIGGDQPEYRPTSRNIIDLSSVASWSQTNGTQGWSISLDAELYSGDPLATVLLCDAQLKVHSSQVTYSEDVLDVKLVPHLNNGSTPAIGNLPLHGILPIVSQGVARSILDVDRDATTHISPISGPLFFSGNFSPAFDYNVWPASPFTPLDLGVIGRNLDAALVSAFKAFSNGVVSLDMGAGAEGVSLLSTTLVNGTILTERVAISTDFTLWILTTGLVLIITMSLVAAGQSLDQERELFTLGNVLTSVKEYQETHKVRLRHFFFTLLPFTRLTCRVYERTPGVRMQPLLLE